MTQKTTPKTPEADELRLLAMAVISAHILDFIPATGAQMSRYIDDTLIGGMGFDSGYVVDAWIALSGSKVHLDIDQVPGVWVAND